MKEMSFSTRRFEGPRERERERERERVVGGVWKFIEPSQGISCWAYI
jgi:hypothetical protein